MSSDLNSDTDILETARNHLNVGDFDKARVLVSKINNYNDNPEALNILALCHAFKNEFKDAEILFNKAINLSRPTEVLLSNLGLSQISQNNTTEAIKSFTHALKINPEHYDAIRNLSFCYDHIGNYKSAYELAKKAYGAKPDDPDIINLLARLSLHNSNTSNAIHLYKRSLNLLPQQPIVYSQLANAYSILKDYENTEITLNKAIKTFPDLPFLSNALARFYQSRNRHNDALLLYDTILQKTPSNTTAIAGKARSLIAMKQFDSAETLLSDALNNFPDNPEISAEYCSYLILNNKFQDAYVLSRSLLDKIEARSEVPPILTLVHSISCRHTSRLDEALKVLNSAVNLTTIPNELEEAIYFSMGDVLDKMKCYDKAFKAYSKANRIISRPTDVQYYKNLHQDITRTINRDFLDSFESPNNQSSLPVFIVGMPRSGTTLVEQIAASHPEVHGAGELTDLWVIGNNISGAMNLVNYTKNLKSIDRNQLDDYANSYIHKLTSLCTGVSRMTDKLPHNYIHIGLIELLFPNAHVIHCQRHPFDTCLSIFFKNFNDSHVYSKKLQELAQVYRCYLDLMKHWGKHSKLPILTVKYEDMIQYQEIESRRLIEFIGLDWTDEILRYFDSDRVIMTPSHHQASKPIYTDSMYRWKHYKEHLQPLIEALGDPEKLM